VAAWGQRQHGLAGGIVCKGEDVYGINKQVFDAIYERHVCIIAKDEVSGRIYLNARPSLAMAMPSQI